MNSSSEGKDVERSYDLRSSSKKSQSTLKITSNERFGDDTSEIPVKKSRRSISRRKSLLETLQSLPGTPTQVSLTDKVTQCVETSSTPIMPATVVIEAPPSSTSACKNSQSRVESDCNDNEDLQFVFEWYSTLNREASDWRLLLKEHKEKEVTAKEALNRVLECDDISTYFDINDNDRNATSNFDARMQSLEQRFVVAATTIKCFYPQMHKIRNVQHCILENIKKRELQKLQNCCDPKDTIEKICYYSDMLSKRCSIDGSTVT